MSSSEFLVAGDRLPGKIELFVSDAFRSYTAKKTDISEFKNWQFELGPVAVDAFRFALESRFTDVTVKLGEPKFPATPGDVFYAAVRPAFREFSASDPVLFRFENYRAKIGFDVTVYNPTGETILANTYVGEGEKQGSIGYADPGHAAYPVAVENAVKDAVTKFVNDLTQVASTAAVATANQGASVH